MTAFATAAVMAIPASADQHTGWSAYNADPQNTMQANVAGPKDPGFKWYVDLDEVETDFAPAGYGGSYNISRPVVAPDGTLVIATKNAEPQYENRIRFGREVIGLDPDDGSVVWEIPNTSTDHDRCSPQIDSQGRLWITKAPPATSDAQWKLGAFDPSTGDAIAGTDIVIEDMTRCNRTSVHIGGEGDNERAVLFGQGGDPSELVAFDISGDAASMAFRGLEGVTEIAGVPGTGGRAEHVGVFTDDALIVAARTGDGEDGILELVRLSLADGSVIDRVEVPTPDAGTTSGYYDRVEMLIVDDLLVVTPQSPRADEERGVVAGLDLADGLSTAWDLPIEDGEPRDLALGDGHVYVQPGNRTASFGGSPTLAIDLETGLIPWMGYAAGVRPVTDVDGNAYTTGRDANMTRDRLIVSFGTNGTARWIIRPEAVAEAAGVDDPDDLNLGGFTGLATGPIDGDGTLYITNTNSQEGILAIDDSGGLGEIPNPFPDVDDDNVHRENIARLAQREITAGDEEGNYNPSGTVTREQFATFLARAFGLDPVDGDHFTDVHPDNVHAGNIYAVADAGITQGVTEDTFAPKGTLPRAQMASLLVRAFGLEEVDGDHFTDVHPDNVHAGNIYAAAEAGITHGTSATTFGPDRTLRRDQMASLLIRGLDSQEG